MGNNVWMIDLLEQGLPGRTAAYLIRDERIALVETGSSLSHDVVLGALAQLDVTPADLDYVMVTHVHLDHAGGAGQMMEKATKATLVCHPRAARHMIDPSRLWQGAQTVYGDQLEKLYGSICPVPESRVMIRDHGETLDLGQRTLTFYDSPGHAKHHFTILDPLSNALLAGDAVGIRYVTQFTGWDYEWVAPSTSPVDFDPAAVHRTMAMLDKVPFEWVYHAHFGKSPKQPAMRDTARIAQAFADLVAELYRPGLPLQELVDALRDLMVRDLMAQGLTPGPLEPLEMDLVVDAMGLLHYEEQRRTVEA